MTKKCPHARAALEVETGDFAIIGMEMLKEMASAWTIVEDCIDGCDDAAMCNS